MTHASRSIDGRSSRFGRRALRGLPLACALVLSTSAGGATVAQEAVTLQFGPPAGTRAHKLFRATHELRIDDMGSIYGDLPYVSDGTAGWISTSHRVELLDEYQRVEGGKPLEFTRQIRDCTIQGKANVTRPNGLVLTEQAPGASPLRRHKVRFTWVERLKDWTRCYTELDGDERWLDELRGDFDFLGLLPAGAVAPGAQWDVDPEALRAALAPGGNHKVTPATDKLFGRLVELGVGGDFADALGPELHGAVKATFRGRREQSEGEGDAAQSFELAEIEYEISLASVADRLMLYVMAMPESERRETARVDAVPLEYTFIGKATLMWDLERKRAHSFKLEGAQSFTSSVSKTRFDGRQSMVITQMGRYSGPLTVEVTVRDGAGVSDVIEPPQRGSRTGQKR